MTIGLTHTENPEKHQYYIDWLKGNEDITVVKLSAEDNNLNELNHCDALVLSGGIDVHPKYYWSTITNYPGAPSEFNEKRDEFEIASFHHAQEKNIPVLGICRGMQLINVIHRGSLIQSLSHEALSEIHHGEPDKSHTIIVKPGTLLHDIIGTDKTEINSAHRQAIDKLGEGLVVNAMSEDGFPEGIERSDKTGKPFLLAVQWHPERMFRFHLEDYPASKAVRDRFISAVKNQISKNEGH